MGAGGQKGQKAHDKICGSLLRVRRFSKWRDGRQSILPFARPEGHPDRTGKSANQRASRHVKERNTHDEGPFHLGDIEQPGGKY